MLKTVLLLSILLRIAQGLLATPLEISTRTKKAEKILKYWNESADPCEDFYNFACGKWQKLNQATEGEPHKNVLWDMNKDFENELRKIVEDRHSFGNDIEIKVSDFYQSCLSRPEPAKEAYRNALKAIISEFGTMPLLEGDNWQEKDFDWLKTVSDIAYKYNIMIIMAYEFLPNPLDNSYYSLSVGHQDFPWPMNFYFNKTGKADLSVRIANVAQHLKQYFELTSKLAQQTASEIVDFEVRLAKGAQRDTYEMEESLVQTNVPRMQSQYAPHLDIESYLFKSLGSLPTGLIYERNEGFHENLIEVLTTTPKRIVANYIYFNLVHRFGWYEENCLRETRKHFLNLLENMWYRRQDLGQTERAIANLFEDLMTVFHSALASTRYKWIGKRVRRYSIEKLNALSLHIKSYQDTNFTAEYEQLLINKSDYIGNLKSIYHLNGLKNRAKHYDSPTTFYDPAKMPYAPLYLRNEHRIIVPLVSLYSSVLWSAPFPNAVNFGQMGFLLAHEIMHAFDDESRFKDKWGNEADWWDIRSKVYFNDRTQCFAAQYHNYTYNDQPWPSSSMQSQNIADNGGIRLAYETYLMWYESTLRPQTNLDMEQLPSLKYKNKQLFFISYAQTLCSATLASYRPYVMAKPTHPPESLRVLGSLSNFEEFSKVFQCPEGSVMNRANKCRVY